jgi:hypothetical protein
MPPVATKQEPKHVKIAREQGAKAGFKAYREFLKRSGIDRVQERYQEMLDQGDVPAQYAWYCKEYADQINPAKPATGRRTTRGTTAAATPATPAGVSPDLLAQFAAFLTSQGAGVAEVEEEETEEDIDEALEGLDEPTTKRGPGRPPGSKNKPKAQPATEGVDTYAPKNPEVNATNGRLWKLNELGLLGILDVPADPITNGEAHEILKANL